MARTKLRRESVRRALAAPWLFDATGAPFDVGGPHAVLIVQDAADPCCGGLPIFRQPDGPAFEVLGLFNAAIGPDIDSAWRKTRETIAGIPTYMDIPRATVRAWLLRDISVMSDT